MLSLCGTHSHRPYMMEAPAPGACCTRQCNSCTCTHPNIPILWSSANNNDIYTDTSSLSSLWVCPIPTASTWLLWGRRISQQVFPQCHQCLVAMRDAILHRRSHFCIPAQRNRTEPFGIILKISVWLGVDMRSSQFVKWSDVLNFESWTLVRTYVYLWHIYTTSPSTSR